MKNLTDDLAHKNYVAGVRQVNRGFAKGSIAKVYIASDASAQFIGSILAAAEKHGVDAVVTGNRKEFSDACGIEVPCAVVGIKND